MNQSEKIDAYINGLLQGDDLINFEIEINNNPGLAKDIEIQRDLIAGIHTYQKNRTKELIAKTHQEFKKQNPKTESPTNMDDEDDQHKIRWWRWAVYIALLASVTIASFYFLFNSPPETDSSNLYASYYTHYIPSIDSRNSITHSIEKKIITAFEQQQYEKSLQWISTIHQDSLNNFHRLMNGQTLMNLDRPQDAIHSFNQILKTDDPFFTDHAVWYKALALLNQGNQRECKKLLQSLTANKNADHYKEAINLLSNL